MLLRFRLCLMLLAVGGASQVMASPVGSTRLVACGAQSCLLIKGTRRDADGPVAVNGHPVMAEGGRSWQIRLPLDTLRAWSVPYAREISITLDGGEPQDISLPIGLLGHTTNLAALEVRAR